MQITDPPAPEPSPDPIRPSTVATQPATVEACASDYSGRSGGAQEHPSSWAASFHTLGHK